MADAGTVLARDIAQDQLLQELRALRPALRQKGVTAMALFGSRARRDNRLDSDIDLAIEVAPDRKFSLIDLSGVSLTIEDRIGLRANLFMRRSLAPDFLKSVQEVEVVVF